MLLQPSALLCAAGVAGVSVMAMLALSGPPPEKGEGFRLDPPKGVKRRKTPIMFVHGMTCGGWVFRALAEKLSAQGWEVHCITMYKNRFKTLGMYMDELQIYIQDNLEQGPILIGHSLGGMLVQHYALNTDTQQPLSKRVQGLVFVAGFGSDNFVLGVRSVLSVLRHNFLGTLWSLIRLNAKFVTGINKQASRQLMFLTQTAQTNIAGEGAEDVESCLSRSSPLESGIVLLDWLRVVAFSAHATTPSALQLPALSVIPACDALLLPWTQRAQAAFWRSEVLLVPDQGHFVGDPGWEQSYGEKLSRWLETKFS